MGKGFHPAAALVGRRSSFACTGILYNEDGMPMETTYTRLRENLASVLDRVVEDREDHIVRRKGSKDVALLPASELAGLMETAHLLRSPRNARRLLTAMRRAKQGKGRRMTVDNLRLEMGLAPRRQA